MNLGEARNRLLDELWRTGEMTAEAEMYIAEAINHYAPKTFWFNEERATANTYQGQKRYALPDDFMRMKVLSIIHDGNEYELKRRTYEEMLELYPDDSEGVPEDYCLDRGEIWLGPVPNSNYTMRILYHKAPQTATAEAQTNIFLTYAPSLVRAHAGVEMSSKILRDPNAAAMFAQTVNTELQALVSETNRRLMTGKTRRRK